MKVRQKHTHTHASWYAASKQYPFSAPHAKFLRCRCDARENLQKSSKVTIYAPPDLTFWGDHPLPHRFALRWKANFFAPHQIPLTEKGVVWRGGDGRKALQLLALYLGVKTNWAPSEGFLSPNSTMSSNPGSVCSGG